jgi:hypothetical protein
VTGDYDSSNDIDTLTAGVEAASAQLLALIGADSHIGDAPKSKPEATKTTSRDHDPPAHAR